MGISSTLTSLSLLLLLHFSEFCTCKCSRWKNEGGWNETGRVEEERKLVLALGQLPVVLLLLSLWLLSLLCIIAF